MPMSFSPQRCKFFQYSISILKIGMRDVGDLKVKLGMGSSHPVPQRHGLEKSQQEKKLIPNAVSCNSFSNKMFDVPQCERQTSIHILKLKPFRQGLTIGQISEDTKL